MVSGTTFAQVLGILATPILTRLYAPDAFGALALFLSIASILGMVACLRYEMAIPLPERDGDAASLLAASLGSVLAVGALAAILTGWSREVIIGWLNVPNLGYMLWLIPVHVLLMGVSQSFSYWNSRMQRFGRVSISHVANSVTATGLKLGAGFAGAVAGGSLIAATMAGQTVSAVVLGARIWRGEGALIRAHARPGEIWAQIKRYRKFPLADIWGALLNNASWQLPTILFAVYFSQAVIGMYALAFRLLQLPMSLIGASLGQVFYQRVSQAHMRGEAIDGLTESVFGRLVALGLFPALLLAVAGPDLFTVVFGAHWREAGVYTQILSFWIFWWFISSPISLNFLILERQGSILAYHVLIFVTRLASILIGGILGDVYLALWLFAGTGFVVYGALTLHTLALSGVSWLRAVRQVRAPLMLALPLTLVVAVCGRLSASAILVCVVATAALAIHVGVTVRRDRALLGLVLAHMPGRK